MYADGIYRERMLHSVRKWLRRIREKGFGMFGQECHPSWSHVQISGEGQNDLRNRRPFHAHRRGYNLRNNENQKRFVKMIAECSGNNGVFF